MNPQNEDLSLPNLVPVENRLILSPEAQSERAAMLAAIEAEEAERADEVEEEIPLNQRCRFSVCKECGHQKLVFLPAKLCEKCLKRKAEEAGVPFPSPGQAALNRAGRRRLQRGR